MRNQILKSFLWVMCAIAFAGCASYDPLRGAIGSYRNYTEIKGKIENGRYTSPVKNFSCAVPDLITPGAVIRDDSHKTSDGSHVGVVGFEDDLGTLYRVDWFEITPDLKGSLSNRELLERIFNYQMSTYQKVTPQTSLEGKDFIGEETNLTLFFSARLPQGATLAENGKRLDCSRGSLIIQRGDWVYSLTTQDTDVHNRKNSTPEERKAALRSELDKFIGGFKFK